LAIVGVAVTRYCAYYESPLGQMLLTASESALTGLHFVGEKCYPKVLPAWRYDADFSVIKATAMQLAEYFTGTRQAFDIALAPEGTEFQRLVWDRLTTIRFGETATYGELAQRIGNANAVRAVGAANGRNPISIVIPCHRVIGADGSLTGYAGGLERKLALLRLESARMEFCLAP
jgi:methylated-DNA-[protein]-cysteine S-methyltransferase